MDLDLGWEPKVIVILESGSLGKLMAKEFIDGSMVMINTIFEVTLTKC